MTEALLPFVRKWSTKFTVLALKVLSVMSITLGDDENEYFEDVYAPVSRLVRDGADDQLVVEALYTMTLVACVNCEDTHLHAQLMQDLGMVFMNTSRFNSDAIVAAMECWAFASTLMVSSSFVPKLGDPTMQLHDHVRALTKFVVQDEDAMIRASACEVLALLVEYKQDVVDDTWHYSEETGPLGGLDVRIEVGCFRLF